MRNRMRQACFLSKVIVFCSVVGWFSIETSSAPLRSPIFRSQRLDYWIADPLAPEGYSYPLRMDSIRLGDFDGDGRQDLLVVNEPCHYVDGGIYVIRLSEGGDVSSTSGTPVREACRQQVAAGPGDSFTVGDFDGDHRTDVAFWRTRTLYRMTPNGSFAGSPFSLPLDLTLGFEEPSYQVSADLNGDGLPDVVVSQPFDVVDFINLDFRFSTNLYVFLADGHGGFVRSQKIEPPANPGLDFRLVPISAKDFNGDGIPDVLGFGTGPRGAWELLLGDGAGHLTPPENSIPLPSLPDYFNFNFMPPPTIGDLNGDHVPDLVFGPSLGPGSILNCSVYFSQGPGVLGTAQMLTASAPGVSPYGAASSIQDIDGNGREDLEFFGEGWTLAFMQDSRGTLHAGPVQRLGMVVKGMLPIRWDEDLLEDQIYYGTPVNPLGLGYSSALSVFLGHTPGNPDTLDLDLSALRMKSRLAVGDFDGDGHQDLAVGSSDEIFYFRGNGRGGLTRVPGIHPASSTGPIQMIAADWNGDGRDDLVTLNPNSANVDGPGSFRIYISQPTGPSFLPGVSLAVGPRPIKAVASDLNNDGKLDLLVGGEGVTFSNSRDLLDGSVVSFLGDGDGGFAPSMPAFTIPPGYHNYEFLDIEAGDVDADGAPDLIVLARIGDFGSNGYWGRGLGDGRFEIPSFFGSTGTSRPGSLLKPQDLNGDGLLDLNLSPSYNTRFSSLTAIAIRGIYLGTSESEFRFAVPSDCCQFPGRFVDLDSDGWVDLLGPVTYFDSLRFGSGAGTGQFRRLGPDYSPSGTVFTSDSLVLPTQYPSPLFADFDEDGRVDAVTSDAAGHVTVMFNRSNRVASDPAESLRETDSGVPSVDPEIDLTEIRGRIGAYDFAGTGTLRGALVFTLALNRQTELNPSGAGMVGGLEGARDGIAPLSPSGDADRIQPGFVKDPAQEALAAKMKSGTFQLFLNFGEPLKDSNGDGIPDLSIANATHEPGLSGFALADVTLTLHLGAKGPFFTGIHDINLFSRVDANRGLATFVVPFEQLLSSLTPAERSAMDQGDGTGRLFLWAVSRLYGDRDRVPDTNDGGEPSVRTEVREFGFPLADLSTTPSLDYGDVRIGRHVDGPLTLCNHGARPVEITQIRLPDSTLTVPLQSPFTVPALGQFQLPLRYSPTAHARISGNLTVETALSELNAKISITGRGVAPILQVTPTSLDFGSVPVGFSSEGRQFAIGNVGDAYLDATWELIDPTLQFSFGGYIPPSGPHPFELYPGESDEVRLTFTPAGIGPMEGTFRIVSDDDRAPQVDVRLSGQGTPAEPRIYVTFVDPIQNVPIGGEGSSVLHIQNWGSALLEVGSVVSSSPLFSTSLSRSSIPSKEWADLVVTYHPVVWGLETTTLTIPSNDPTNPTVTRMVSGQAFEPPPEIHVSPVLLDFGTLHQGSSATLSFDVSNTGAGPLRLTGNSPLLTSACNAQTDLSLPATLLPGGTLTAQVTLTADIDKSFCFILFYTNAPGTPYVTMELRATILSPVLYLTTDSLSFPETRIGSSSTVLLKVYNDGQEPLIISRATYLNSPFSLATALPFTVSPYTSGDLPFKFSPTAEGGWGAAVILRTNDLRQRDVPLYLYGFAFSPPPSVKPLILGN